MQGGPSQNLTNVATNIWSFMVQNQIQVKVRRLRGRKDYVADQLSHYSSKYEWMIHPRVFRYLDTIWGPHTYDRFAPYLTTQVTKYYLIHAGSATSRVDALVKMD